MNAVEFDIEPLHPVYLIRGSDAFLKDGVLKKLKSVVLSELRDVDFARFDEDATVFDVITAAETFSFFEGKKVLYYKAPSAKLSEADKNALAEYCKNPNLTTVLVLDDPEGVFKFLDRYAEIVKCENPGDGFILRWIKNVLSQYGVGCDADAALILLKYCGGNMMRIHTELKKLAAYTDAKKYIASSDVALCVAPDTEHQIYELTDKLSRRDGQGAVAIYGILTGRGESPAFLLAAITAQFRRIMHILLTDFSDSELALLFKVKEYSITVSRRVSANFSKSKIKKIVDLLSLNEYLFKSGTIGERAALDLSFAYLLTV